MSHAAGNQPPAGAPAGAPGGVHADDLRNPRRRSRIAQERLGPGRASWQFVTAMTAFGIVAFAVYVYLVSRPAQITGGELAAREDATLIAWLLRALPLEAARVLAAAAGAAAIVCVGVVARRLLHGQGPALLAMALVALDPALLIAAHLALPHVFVLATSLGALALFLLPDVRLHWVASGLFLLACLMEPAAIVWALPLTLLVLIRGHIYAAPVHALTAVGQAFLLPAVGAIIVGWARLDSDRAAAACLSPHWADSLLLRQVPDLGGVVLLPNPALWFVGIAALVALGALALSQVLLQFRVGRLPGRIQLRLPRPLPALHARMLWLLALALFAPHPYVWLALGAIAVASGIRELGHDAPGFGLALGITAIAFALLWVVRALPLIIGTASPAEVEQLMRAVPWATTLGCG